ncbi:hypothetical protein ACHHYP_08635 [Achlya hypogyna]|uniref:Uncharacterized protein n=1 Tax=Achlya hypogyna TaxID=1202772 RepID=A0A1V9ZKD6_ACHHY|nr:hypothetical protein ACHHYP_08635 [Achlya hypogyna]
MDPNSAGMAACLVISDTGHVLLQYLLQAVDFKSAQLASLVATLQQFSRGQAMAMVALYRYVIVVLSDETAPVLVAIVCFSETDAALARLAGMHLLHECLRFFGTAALHRLVADLKAGAEAQSASYTLSAALQGQGSTDGTLNSFASFEAAVVEPFFDRLPALVALLGANAFFVNCHLREAVASQPPPPALVAAVTDVAGASPLRLATARTRGSCAHTYVALAASGVPGFCAAVVYAGPDAWFDGAASAGASVPAAPAWTVLQDVRDASARADLARLCEPFGHPPTPPDSPRPPELAKH